MKKHSMFRTCLLVVLVVAGLLLLSGLPDWGVGEWEARRVDLLSDVLPPDSSQTTPVVAEIPIPADSCKPGVTCISDFATEEAENMSLFYEALNEASQRVVRIAYIGDSFIEGDILTDQLRDLLQAHYGGMGVGYVGLNHVAVAGRKTIVQSRSGVEMHSAVDKHFDATLPDLSGYYFVPQGTVNVSLRGNSEYSSRLERADVSQFILLTRGQPATLTATNEAGQTQHFTTASGTSLQAVTFQAPMHSVAWTMSQSSGVIPYAVTMEGRTGIVVDNLSLRGSSGLPLMVIPTERLNELNSIRHYDLVVLQFGLNVMLRGKTNYSAYGEQLQRVIDHLRTSMPTTAFLVMGIGDRGGKLRTGEIGTMPEVVPLQEAQATAAAATGVAFWNTYEAMGGEGSMIGFAQAKPVMAAKDYTHINEAGGARIARLIYDAMVWGHELYNLKHHPSLAAPNQDETP